MPANPYQSLPNHCFWRRSIAGVNHSEVDPVIQAKFQISRTDRIATAGSCFAQHLAQHLEKNGLNYFVTETAHPLVAHLAADYNYGLFTARYGNIYTSRQFIQTLKRAYGLFEPTDLAWSAEEGRAIDPFRPLVQPNGFASVDELIEDRQQHFAAIRRAIEELDVLIFTLGLTEAWCCRTDGATYPLCPGVAGGTFDSSRHTFVNLRVGEVIADLEEAIDFISDRNPGARIILTVSPVPLIATMEDRSVLVSTTYSKSVLRVAADEIAARHQQVAYYPSYEIVTGNYARGSYFADDLRDVTEAGVSHVMRLFIKHYTSSEKVIGVRQPPLPAGRVFPAEQRDLAEVAAVLCDEVLLDTKARDVSARASLRQHVAPTTPENEDSATAVGNTTEGLPDPSSAWRYLRGAPAESQSRHVGQRLATATSNERSFWRRLLDWLWRS